MRHQLNSNSFLALSFFLLLLFFSCKNNNTPEMILEDGTIIKHINGDFKEKPTAIKSEIRYNACYYQDNKIVQTTYTNGEWEKFIIPQDLPPKNYSPMLKAMIYMEDGDSTYLELPSLHKEETLGIGIKVYEVLNQDQLSSIENEYRKQAAEHTDKLLEIVENRKKYKSQFKKISAGLSKMVLAKGNGTKIKINHQLKLRYIACTENLALYEAKYSYTDPFILKMDNGGYIEGFIESIQGMELGERSIFEIASSKAYGKSGLPPIIQANETLYFYIEIEEIL